MSGNGATQRSAIRQLSDRQARGSFAEQPFGGYLHDQCRPSPNEMGADLPVTDSLADGSPSWKVGVIKVGRLREKFGHKELLAPGLDPGQRMNELVHSIAQGDRG